MRSSVVTPSFLLTISIGMRILEDILFPFEAEAQVSFANDVQPIFDTNCQARGCHPGGGAPFSLDRFVSYQNLVNAPVSNTSCGVPFRVTPFVADSSLLYLLVSGRTLCARMPLTLQPGDTLSLNDQNTIRDWINEGAWQDPLLQLSAAYAFDENTAVVAGGTGTVIKTTNRGLTWAGQVTGTENDLYALEFTDSNTGWAVGGGGTIVHTNDGGSTWGAQQSETTNWLDDVDFTDPNTGWAVGESGTILHTTDGGDAWNTQTSGTSEVLLSVHFIDSNTGWAVGTFGTILHTTNGGTAWNHQPSETLSPLISVHFIDSGTGWAVTYLGMILHTVDSGATWRSTVPSGTIYPLNSACFDDSGDLWAVGGSGTILHMILGDTAWVIQESGTMNSLHGVHFADTNNGWAVGWSGIILHTSDGGENWNRQPGDGITIDGEFSEPGYQVLATKLNSNSGFGADVDVTNIYHTTDSLYLYLGFECAVQDTVNQYNEQPDGLGVWLNTTNQVGMGAGQSLGIPVTTNYHYLNGWVDGGYSMWYYTADFEVDYLFAFYSNETPDTIICDVATHVAGRPSSIQHLARTDQYGTSVSGPDIDGVFTAGSVTVSFQRSDTSGDRKGAEIRIPFSELGGDASTEFELFAFLVASTGYCSDVTIPGDITTGNLGWNPQFHLLPGGPFHIGIMTTVDQSDERPTGFELLQNYPNPFNPSTTIEYTLPRSAQVRLEVFNILGERVGVLTDGLQDPGYHSSVFDAEGLPSGIYFYRLQAGDFVQTKKLVLMR